jgi:hypothetical protein
MKRMSISRYAPLVFVIAALFIATMAACSPTVSIEVINPTDETLYVEINEAKPVPVEARASARVHIPGLENLAPVTVIARDVRGKTRFATTTSAALLRASHDQITLAQEGRPYDPLLGDSSRLTP